MKEIIIVLFKDFETLDVFGPAEIFGRLKDHFRQEFYSLNGGVITNNHNIKIMTSSFSKIQSKNYILFIPGGAGVKELVKNAEYISILKTLAENAEYILTVCTGSILLSKTGLLNAKRATSNKRVFSWAEKETAEVSWVKKARWIKEKNIYTSSGVSAGLDMSLEFVADTLGHDIAKQQAVEIEYVWNEDSSLDKFADLYK